MARSLSTLVDHSLEQRLEGDGESRFSMLEIIRAFAWDRLRASGEEPEARSRHAAWVVGLVDDLEAWVAAYLPHGHRVLDRLETEYANLDTALRWFHETDRVSELLSLAAALVDFWRLRGHLREGRQWLATGLAHPAGSDPAARARAELALAVLLHMQHETKLALTLCEASLRFFRASADGKRVARAASEAARIALDAGRADLTDAYRIEATTALGALAGASWAPAASSRLHVLPGILAKNQGDAERAERLPGEVVAAERALARESGAEQPHAGWPFIAWSSVAHLVRDLPVALERYQAALDHARWGEEARCRAYALTRVASILVMTGRWEEAAWMLGAAEAFSEQIGLAFTRDVWSLTRAFGVPQSWQGPDDYTGQARAIQTAVLRRAPAALPPISESDRAIALWCAGRRLPIEEATTYAPAVTLHGPPPRQPVLALPQRSTPADYGLTPRQLEILGPLCDRLTDPEIAARLSISSRTVEGHVTQILGKLQVANRREAAAQAVRQALVGRP
jgi:DNA-binding CsgD family transcriptional regulator